MESNVYHRRNMAVRYASLILSPRSSSGLFMSAPRRTGKSTFIRENRIPELKGCAGNQIIYVDLWADRSIDPGVAISKAIQKRLQENVPLLIKLAAKASISKIGFAGFNLDVSKIGIGGSETLLDALSALSVASESMIILVIDEAQHATTTDSGVNAMFALKSARDALNSSEFYGFRLVATGSSRDKLSTMVNGKDSAFFGASLNEMPLLGKDYIEWEKAKFAAEFGLSPSIEIMVKMFSECGSRPEYLVRALNSLAMDFELKNEMVDIRFEQEVKRGIESLKNDFLRLVNSLPFMQMAVLLVMAEDGDSFAPYQAGTVEKYKLICNQFVDSAPNIDTSSIKYALDALRDKSIIWSSARGVYAIEDAQHADWVKEKMRPEQAATSTPRVKM